MQALKQPIQTSVRMLRDYVENSDSALLVYRAHLVAD